jgi:class 3 adenylate cyclase
MTRVAKDAGEALARPGSPVRAFFEKEECEAFVLVADLRRSTDLMEKATSNRAFGDFLVALMAALHSSITNNHGVLDKFMGDGALAYFPLPFSGPDAGFHAAMAAVECHAEMERLYRAHRSAFQGVLATGFGIGLDYGSVGLIQLPDGITVLGRPVVYASRFAQGSAAGETVLNQQAYDKIVSRFGGLFSLTETLVDVKNDKPHVAHSLKRNRRAFNPAGPGWPTLTM